MQPAPRKSKTGLVVGMAGGGALALVIVLVVAFVVLRPGGASGGEQNVAVDGGIAWTSPKPTSKAEAKLLNVYLLDDTLIRVSAAGLAAYSLADGQVMWTLKPPPGSTVCAASPTPTKTASGKVVAGLVWGNADDHECTTVVAVDLKRGEGLWKATPEAEDLLTVPSEAAVAAADGKIYAPWPGGNGVSASDIESAKTVWDTRAKKDCEVGDLAVHDNTVLVVANCSLKFIGYVMALDSSTGKVSWTSALQIKFISNPPRIVSVQPPVIHVGDPKNADMINTSDGDLYVFDDAGELRTTIPVEAEGEAADLEVGSEADISLTDSNHRYYPMPVVGNVLVAATENTRDHNSQTPQRTKVVGVDLTTGERAWATELAARSYVVARSTDPERVVVVGIPANGNARLFTVNPRDGTVTPGDTLAKPKAGYKVETVRFVAAGTALIQLTINGNSPRPMIVFYRGKP